MAVASIVSAVALKSSTHRTYSTHWKTYIIFCLSFHLDPLVLEAYDVIHYNSPQSASKVEVRFTRFAIYLGCQRHPSKA